MTVRNVLFYNSVYNLCSSGNYAILFTALFKREIFLEEVFL